MPLINRVMHWIYTISSTSDPTKGKNFKRKCTYACFSQADWQTNKNAKNQRSLRKSVLEFFHYLSR